MIKFLKLSILILLSHHVIYSQQFEPCLASATNKRLNDGYSFALAKVQDTSAVSGPQEACYYSCGARLVTYSNNKGDMKKLTAIDKAMPHLTLIKFLKAGQSYFVNHLGVSDNEGSNGVGCIWVTDSNKIKRYPRSHAVCSQASTAICGFWGQQKIPSAPKSNGSKQTDQPSKLVESSPTVVGVASTALQTNPQPTKEAALVTSLQQPMPSSSAGNLPATVGKVNQFKMNGNQYFIINQLQNSFESAQAACSSSGSVLGAVNFADMQNLSNELKKTIAGKVIVGSWNGDSYSLQGSSCLMLDTQLGILPGSCADADAILCQL